jgi:hypothetical protein
LGAGWGLGVRVSQLGRDSDRGVRESQLGGRSDRPRLRSGPRSVSLKESLGVFLPLVASLECGLGGGRRLGSCQGIIVFGPERARSSETVEVGVGGLAGRGWVAASSGWSTVVVRPSSRCRACLAMLVTHGGVGGRGVVLVAVSLRRGAGDQLAGSLARHTAGRCTASGVGVGVGVGVSVDVSVGVGAWGSTAASSSSAAVLGREGPPSAASVGGGRVSARGSVDEAAVGSASGGVSGSMSS